MAWKDMEFVRKLGRRSQVKQSQDEQSQDEVEIERLIQEWKQLEKQWKQAD